MCICLMTLKVIMKSAPVSAPNSELVESWVLVKEKSNPIQQTCTLDTCSCLFVGTGR